MKILVIAPHMDDETLGMGGAIARHVARRDEVHVCFVAHRVYGHKFDLNLNDIERDCALKAKKILGYKEAVFLDLSDERLDICLQDIIIPLEKKIDSFRPEVVYLPHRGDNNQDHRAVFDAARVALRPAATPYVRRLLCYEAPSSTEQSPPLPESAFIPNCWTDIAPWLAKKMKALACYRTEMRRSPHPRSEEGVRILAKYRGIQSGLRAAEAFTILRDIDG